MFERFIERLSQSDYKNNFILKGGMLIAAIVGIHNRATMDMDTTIKNYPVTIESLTKAIKEIYNINLNDDVVFSFTGIRSIRNDYLLILVSLLFSFSSLFFNFPFLKSIELDLLN